MAPPGASVIIPNYQGRPHLGPCLDSLFASPGPAEGFEVLLVDNASTDGSVAWAARRYPRLRTVENPENLGFTGAIRAGAEAARGDVLVFLNNDTRVDGAWLGTLTGALEEAPPEVGTVSGKILSWDGRRIDFYRGAVTFDGHAFQLDFHRPLSEVAAADRPAELPFPCGGNMAVRRALWERSGGFDDDYFAYTEDVDFGWRTWIAGWDHRYEPRAVVYHRSGATGESLGLHRRGYLFEKNAFMTAYKNLEEERFRELMPPILWTLLHRAWSLLESNNADGPLLAGYPFPPHLPSDPATAPPAEGLWRRIRRYGPREALRRGLLKAARRLGGQGGAQRLVVHDSRTLEVLRSVHFLLRNLDRLAERRRAVQAGRVRGDGEYFRRFPLLLVPTYPGDERLFSSPGFAAWLPAGVELVRRRLDEIGELP